MGRKSLTRVDYEDMGKSKGIEFIGSSVPATVYEATSWRCLNCGIVMKKTFRAVRWCEKGCLCYTPATLKPEDYQALAGRYADPEGHTLLWVGGEYFPHSTKTKTTWRTPAGIEFEASYHQLGYTRPPVKIRDIFDAEAITSGQPAAENGER